MKNHLKPYICPQCGGRVDRARLICESCGTMFRFEDDALDLLKVVAYRPGVHVLMNQRMVSDDMLFSVGAEKASEIALKQMAAEMGQLIAPFMDIKMERNDMLRTTKATSRIRVLDPTYRF